MQKSEQNVKKAIKGYQDLAMGDAALFEELVQRDPRVEIFWQTSAVAVEILKWYPFESSEQVLFIGDDYDNLKKALGRGDKVIGESYRYAVWNLRKYPEQSPLNMYIFAHNLESIMRQLCEDGILLILCTKNDAREMDDVVQIQGLLNGNLYDPLHIGLCVYELSKAEVSDKKALIPSETYAQKLLACKWTKTFGIPFFGEQVENQDEDLERISQVREVQLDLLRKLKSICEKYDLKMIPMYGTLLGAARSAGMIAGDDDIDVALPREDFDKLIRVSTELEEPYFLQTPANDDCFFGGYLKLRNKSTTAIHPQNWWADCCEGISIDVFPIDYGFANSRKEKRKIFFIKHIQRLLYAKAYGHAARFLDMKLLKWKGYKYIGKLFSREQLAGWLNKALQWGEDENEAPIGIYAHYQGGAGVRYIDRKALAEETLLKFENMVFKVPAGWNGILRNFYGDSYMVERPWNRYNMRHGFYDVNTPYELYLDRFHGLHRTKTAEGKEIVLFGMDVLMNAYLKRYSHEKYHPSKLVFIEDEEYELRRKLESETDNLKEEIKYNPLDGIEMVSKEYFVNQDLSKYYPVICAIDGRKVEIILQDIGFKEYYFFWANRDWMLRANLQSVRDDVRWMEKEG